jgi:Domain of unknown function (DUF397)
MITNWRKSRYSGNSGGNCVEVGSEPGIVGIRDSKNRSGGHLTVSPRAWTGFVTTLARPA